MREEIMGIPFDNVTMEEALDAALRLLEKPGASYGVMPNSEIVYETLSDNALREKSPPKASKSAIYFMYFASCSFWRRACSSFVMIPVSFLLRDKILWL